MQQAVGPAVVDDELALRDELGGQLSRDLQGDVSSEMETAEAMAWATI
jgi:hypothetical protein